MLDRVKIYTFVGLIVVFSMLFLFSINWRNRKLPEIRYCCQDRNSCQGFDEITAQAINSTWNHNTRYKVVKGMKCDLGFQERAKFFIKKASLGMTQCVYLNFLFANNGTEVDFSIMYLQNI